MHLNRQGIKIGLSALGAVVAVGGATQLVKPPPLTRVAVLKHAVAALSPVTSQNITWVNMEHPPQGTITAWTGDPLAAAALAGGTVLTQADFSSAAQAVALKSGEVRYVVTVTPASAVVTVGQRVDLWGLASTNGSSSGTAPKELAQGVRVIGLYTSAGTPIGATNTGGGGFLSGGSSSTPQAPALAALAIPSAALSAMMAADPSQTMLLVQDPSQSKFALITGSSTTTTTPSSGTSRSHTTHTTPSKATTTTHPSQAVRAPHSSGSTTTHTKK